MGQQQQQGIIFTGGEYAVAAAQLMKTNYSVPAIVFIGIRWGIATQQLGPGPVGGTR